MLVLFFVNQTSINRSFKFEYRHGEKRERKKSELSESERIFTESLYSKFESIKL